MTLERINKLQDEIATRPRIWETIAQDDLKELLAAAETVERLRECAKRFVGAIEIISFESSAWHVVSASRKNRLVAQGEAETLELAICNFSKALPAK